MPIFITGGVVDAAGFVVHMNIDTRIYLHRSLVSHLYAIQHHAVNRISYSETRVLLIAYIFQNTDRVSILCIYVCHANDSSSLPSNPRIMPSFHLIK
ncbi:hypothetical protein CW304_04705 [Bacillus sp. UFRGS-B20]|nr:hypothetical protein CW304_04705 [Bacillus sp. UFRGS-B20]